MADAAKAFVIAVNGVLLTLACYFAPYNQRIHWVQWSFWGFFCGLLLPLGVSLALGLKAKDLGLRLGDWRFGIASILLGLLIMFGFGLWASFQTEFQAYYSMIVSFHKSSPFLFWLSLFAYMIGWEFLFRGFLLFGIAGKPTENELLPKKLKVWAAIGFSTLLFGLSHWGKPFPELVGSFLAGVILCLIAWRTKSCLAPILLHSLVFGMFTLMVQFSQSS
ncbi:MAG: CPBP family intramembrane metalloprotease [Armatimonadetes bacterium]|nr:CPBP family intramembrane metalloprotease [Armatimonadota bacterium]